MSEQHTPASAIALFLIAPTLFASNILVARWVAGDIPPMALAFGRWSLTFLFLLPICGRRLWRARAEAWRDWPSLLALGALGMGVCGAPVYIAGQTTTATNIGLIYAASPILIVALDRLFWRQTIAWQQVAGIALALTGVLTIIARGDPAALIELRFTQGDLWAVFAMSGWALYSLLLKHRPSLLDLTARFAAIVAGGVAVNLPFLGLELASGLAPRLDVHTVGVMLLVALVPGLAAYLAWGRLVASIGAGRTGLLMYLIPLYNAGLAWLLLGEALRAFHLFGAMLVLPGVYLATARPRAPDQAEATAR